MEDERRRFGVGRIITTIGAIWFGLFFAANAGLFGTNQFTIVIQGMGAFFPIAMMCAGRVIRRREKRRTIDSEIEVLTRPSPRPSPQRPSRPADPVTIEELADAVKFEELEEIPEPTNIEPTPLPTPIDPDLETMTSAEMVAEARKKLASDQ